MEPSKKLLPHLDAGVIVETITDGFFAIDHNFHVLYFNHAAETMLGVERGEVLGQNLWDVFPQAVNTLFFTTYERAGRDRIAVTVEEYYAPLDAWYEARVYPTPEGLHIYFRDVTERKRAELDQQARRQQLEDEVLARTAALEAANVALRESQRLNDKITRAIPDTIYIFDLIEARHLYVSDSIYTMLGYQAEDFIRSSNPSSPFMTHPDDIPTLQLTDARLRQAADGEFVETVVRNQHANGEWRWFNLRETVFTREPDGRPRQILGISQDVTERKRMEDELRAALQNERELNTLKLRFVSMAAHEFRTPLAAIQSTIDILRHYGQKMDEAQRRQRFERVDTQIQRMTMLIENVLMVGRMQAGTVVFEPASVNLNCICREVVDDLSSDLNDSHSLHYTFIGDNPTMYADARLFRQALHNLVTNAIKYSPNGGAIEVELEVMKDGASLRVSDSGIGIPVAECERLFEAFQRGSNVGSIPGTGLGMAIIKHVVDLHGGAVEVDSAPNAGTSFRVWIPRDR